ncbi:exodeoxyribonuclease VII small subunit [Candidatus Pandoraea novymonadis]|uniref:Exodeoxyribonuclease 7 small subunit n=1 Tax=Candidatus Pandoraea novymonadis TaxID=1808959 RepID=A0ABX5FEF6_9BURK|nr:exodeoxyribonuclease VII small subunit [Candidatus Pandoraea novymonadis]PSB92090.1 Exodeoxyribonuclease 7 small subunit [Candidatus Pandoraea novymonadis]
MVKTSKIKVLATEKVGLPSNYETALAELELLIGRMEGDELGIEELLDAYRRGVLLVKYCQELLEKVEQQVKVLEGETLRPLTLSRDE